MEFNDSEVQEFDIKNLCQKLHLITAMTPFPNSPKITLSLHPNGIYRVWAWGGGVGVMGGGGG